MKLLWGRGVWKIFQARKFFNGQFQKPGCKTLCFHNYIKKYSEFAAMWNYCVVVEFKRYFRHGSSFMVNFKNWDVKLSAFTIISKVFRIYCNVKLLCLKDVFSEGRCKMSPQKVFRERVTGEFGKCLSRPCLHDHLLLGNIFRYTRTHSNNIITENGLKFDQKKSWNQKGKSWFSLKLTSL